MRKSNWVDCGQTGITKQDMIKRATEEICLIYYRRILGNTLSVENRRMWRKNAYEEMELRSFYADYLYVFGTICIEENMDYFIEGEKSGGVQRVNEFPYNVCELV